MLDRRAMLNGLLVPRIRLRQGFLLVLLILSTAAVIQIEACLANDNQTAVDGSLTHAIETAAGTPDSSTPAESALVENSLISQVGIQGTWKLGHHCPIQLTVPQNLRSQTVEGQIVTLDGDGVEVTYRQNLLPGQTIVVIPATIGSLQSTLTARLVDQQGQILATQELSLSQTSGLPSTQPLIVCFGSSMGVEELVRVASNQVEGSFSIVTIDQPEAMPSSWQAYQACNLVVLSTANIDLMKRMQPNQWQALEQWIRRGGGCVIALGGDAESLQSLTGLQSLLPGSIVGDSTIRNPAALESMIISEQQLRTFPAIQLQMVRGKVQLSLKDALTNQLPWWISYSNGHGSIQLVASDLGHASFANWKHRKVLWQRLIQGYFDKSQVVGSQGQDDSSTSYLGYGDLIGQLRATLDNFASLQVVGISQIAAILAVILLLIGPVDYWISVRWLRRPELSWPLALVILTASAALLTWYYQQVRPNKIIANCVNILDVDPATGQIDGHWWSHIYSAQARKLSISAPLSLINEPIYLNWQGLPGNGLGELESQMPIQHGMPGYEIQITQANNASSVNEVSIAAAGTKAFYGSYSLPLQMNSQSSLRELPTVDQIEGEVVNPLDRELRDVVLFYHRWHYRLDSRLAPGGSIKISPQIIPKDISRRLNRQREDDGQTVATRWNPGERSEVDRLLELMMFHQAASGRNYSSLTHNFQSIVDHSNLLALDQAILLGRLEDAPVKLKISTPVGDTPEIENGVDRTWCRIIIPVDSSSASKRRR